MQHYYFLFIPLFPSLFRKLYPSILIQFSTIISSQIAFCCISLRGKQALIWKNLHFQQYLQGYKYDVMENGYSSRYSVPRFSLLDEALDIGRFIENMNILSFCKSRNSYTSRRIHPLKVSATCLSSCTTKFRKHQLAWRTSCVVPLFET